MWRSPFQGTVPHKLWHAPDFACHSFAEVDIDDRVDRLSHKIMVALLTVIVNIYS